jgi:hypothetical protein
MPPERLSQRADSIPNTASNPAITQDIGQQAGQMLDMFCQLGTPTAGCNAWAPDSTKLNTEGNYTVPAGKLLVITSADLLALGSDANGSCSAYTYVILSAGRSVDNWMLTAQRRHVALSVPTRFRNWTGHKHGT